MNEETAQAELLPVRGEARCTAAGFVLAAVGWTAMGVWQIRLAVTGEPASGPPDQGLYHRPLTGLENAYHLVGDFADAATALCALLFVMWLIRIRTNARLISGEEARHHGLWVYGSWVVPVANLWAHREVIVDVHRRSAPGRPLPRVVNVWWALWVVGELTGAGLMYTGKPDDVIARAYTHVAPLLVADAALVAAAVAGIFVVRAVSAVQQEHIDGAYAPEPSPAQSAPLP